MWSKSNWLNKFIWHLRTQGPLYDIEESAFILNIVNLKPQYHQMK